MGTATFQGTVIAVQDQNDHYLLEVGTSGAIPRVITTENLIREAGGILVEATLPEAFEAENNTAKDPFGDYAEERETYRDLYERRNPPILRVKITVEVEELTDEEAGVVWAQHLKQVSHGEESPTMDQGSNSGSG